MSKKTNRKHPKKQQPILYSVKEVIEYVVENGEQWFKIHWEGYPRDEATWEKIESLNSDFDYIIQRFREEWRIKKEEQVQEQQKKSKLRLQNQNLAKPNQDQASYKRIQFKKRNSVEVAQQVPRQPQKHNDKKVIHYEAQVQRDQSISKREIKIQSRRMIQQYHQVKKGNDFPLRRFKEDNSHSELQRVEEFKEQKSKKIKRIVPRQHQNFRKPRAQKQQLSEEEREEINKKNMFKKLPVTKILNKLHYKNKVLYQIQVDYRGVDTCRPIIFHEKYVETYWPEHLMTFVSKREKQMKNQSENQEFD